ncbi:MAG: NUDIX hydrolase [Roseibium sp.]
MTLTQTNSYDGSSWIQILQGMFRRPARLQIAALCVRERAGVRQVLMVTSKSARRWILPKGWPIMTRRAHRTASIEAFEEAGIIGKARKKPIGSFQSFKGVEAGFRLRTRVLVYRVDVTETTKEFPESGKRDVRWVSVPAAIKLADEPGLVKVLRQLDDEPVN